MQGTLLLLLCYLPHQSACVVVVHFPKNPLKSSANVAYIGNVSIHVPHARTHAPRIGQSTFQSARVTQLLRLNPPRELPRPPAPHQSRPRATRNARAHMPLTHAPARAPRPFLPRTRGASSKPNSRVYFFINGAFPARAHNRRRVVANASRATSVSTQRTHLQRMRCRYRSAATWRRRRRL